MTDEINVVSRTQKIVVEPTSKSVSIFNAGPQGPAGVSLSAETTIYAEPGGYTWEKPTDASFIYVVCIGAGGGGGSGRRGASGTGRSGGGGGGGGGYSTLFLPAFILPSTMSVVVGDGGNGAPARTTDNTDGGIGGQGDASRFIAEAPEGFFYSVHYCVAYGGEGGDQGDLDAPADIDPEGKGGVGLNWGSSGGGSPGTISDYGGSSDARGLSSNRYRHGLVEDITFFPLHQSRYTPTFFGGVGGGGGGGIFSDDVWAYGGESNSQPFDVGFGAGGGGFGLGPEGEDGFDGGFVDWSAQPLVGMGGGGGGASGHTVAAGAGGNGATPGGGGGGGGASTNGFNSGAGGNGGNGLVVVMSW